MIVFVVVFLATLIYFIKYVRLARTRDTVESCTIHTWTTVNGIMFCSICKYSPKLKEWYGDSE